MRERGREREHLCVRERRERVCVRESLCERVCVWKREKDRV